MNNTNNKIEELWNELIVKEKIDTIIKLVTELQESIINLENNMQHIIQQELITQWNTSDIPTFKIILEKLNMLIVTMEKGKNIIQENEGKEKSDEIEKQKSKKEKTEIGFNYSYGFQFKSPEKYKSVWNKGDWKRKI